MEKKIERAIRKSNRRKCKYAWGFPEGVRGYQRAWVGRWVLIQTVNCLRAELRVIKLLFYVLKNSSLMKQMNHIFIKIYFKLLWDFGITFFLCVPEDKFFLRVSVGVQIWIRENIRVWHAYFLHTNKVSAFAVILYFIATSFY